MGEGPKETSEDKQKAVEPALWGKKGGVKSFNVWKDGSEGISSQYSSI